MTTHEQVRPSDTGRRRFFRLLGWGGLLALLGQWSLGLLSYLRPIRTGTFGSTVVAGTVDEFKLGEVRRIPEGRFFVSRVPEGFLALWWKCPHLGCTVPWKPDEPTEDAIAARGRFHCPCHASQYNRYGQIIRGPATRPMDRFPVRIEAGKVLVDTGPDRAIRRDRSRPEDATPI